MASNGQFNTTSSDGRYLTFNWSIASQSVADNTTTISWSLKGAGTSGYVTCGNFKVVIDGETVYSSSGRIKVYNTTTVASGTKIIQHNTDGTRSFSASAQAGIYYFAVNCKGSGSWDLTAIPRYATITSAPNFNDEGNPTITYANKAGNNVTSLQVCIADKNGTTIYVPYRDVSITGSSYTFNLTDTERHTLRNATPSSNSLEVKFYIKTVLSGETYYHSVSKNMSIVNANPTFTFELEDISSDTPVKGTLIKGISTVYFTVNASGKKGTSIAKIEVTHDIKKVTTEGENAAEGSFVMVQSGIFTVVVTDRRGNTSKQTSILPFIEYFKPTATVELSTPKIENELGEVEVTVKGNFYNGSLGGDVNNNIWLDLVVYNITDDTLEAIYSLNSIGIDKSGNTYSCTTTIGDLDYRKYYSVEVSYSDWLSDTELSKVYPIRFSPLFDWGENDFRFNVPVNFTAGIANSNKVLWSGASHMNGNQSISLSENVSAQNNGIVLVFSYYDGTNALNHSFTTHYIPKYQIAAFPNCGHTFLMAINAGFSNVGAKYLTFTDDTITGHSGNTTSGTNSGISYNNNNYVLRYVIGV